MRRLTYDSLGRRHMKLAGRVRQERQKPNLRGFKVYIGDFVAPEDPGNDPQDLGANPPIDTSPSSPPYLNGFYYDTYPLWFAHGLDGETDMGGMYDLITGGPGGVPPVSGDIAWNCPAEWRDGMQLFADFAVLLDDPGDPEDRVYGMALQVFDPASGNVRVYWPLYATALP